jgi:CheY-like chemotaxis protein
MPEFSKIIELPAEFTGLLGEFWSRSALGFCLTDADGGIVAVNAAFCSAVGRVASGLVGTSSMGLIAAEASVQGSLAHTAFIEGDDAAMAGLVYLHKSGRPIFTHVTDTRVHLPDGRVFRLTSLIDLAGQVQGVGPLREHQRAKNFSALASDISNDFNNLLSIILGYTAFIQDSVRDPVRLNTAVVGIEHAVRRAANLIRQTLHLSRRDELVFQRTEVGYFVREFYRMTEETLTTGIEFNLNIKERLPAVSLDTQHFHHALANLGQKARDMIGTGGRMTVEVCAVAGGDVRSKFVNARQPEYVMLVLRAEPAAFKLAEQENKELWDEAVWFAERRRDLSVLVVHGILAGHHGHLEVDARSGAALVFRLYLPALTDAPPEPVVAPAPEVPAGKFTVLLVDDEETILHTVKDSLEHNGFRVIEARDGLEAVQLFSAHAATISVVLIDLGLPRMSGWEAFRKIKERSPAATVVVMSGHLEPNLKTKLIKGGAFGFLQKPFALTEALAEIKRACVRVS